MLKEYSCLTLSRSATEQKLLLGHSGPVYGLSFNDDKSFLVSSSEDGTGLEKCIMY